MARGEHDAPTDPDAGIWRGRQVARRFVSPDGMVVLVGKAAEDNDVLSLKLGAPRDFWLHVAGPAGSHVVVKNPLELEELPRPELERAAELAAWHSKARGARGKVEVHVCRVADVRKPRGFAAGQVQLKRWDSIKVYPRGLDEPEG